jgi:hypothetical protein
VVLVAFPAAAEGPPIPDEIYGSYAPGGNCAALPRVTVNSGGIFLDTAVGKSGPLPVSVCYSCAGGARYEGIQRWAYVKYGKDKWGGDNSPVIFMFNADERKGIMQVTHDDTLKTPLGGPMNAVVRARSFRVCAPGTVSSALAKPVTAGALPAGALTPAKGFAATLGALLRPASMPTNSFYDWRTLEAAPSVTWAALPPEMLDKPMSNGEYFRRSGTISLSGQTVKVLAGGARTMVTNLYFRNDGPPIGEVTLLLALRDAGFQVTPARCTKVKMAGAPTWYRLSGPARQTAMLWIAPARGTQQPWEGYGLRLDGELPPLTPKEAVVYTNSCS